MEPVAVNTAPDARYAAANRHWQGIPSIERARNGRLWASWYSGGRQEDNDNHCLLVTSEDDGRSWSEPVAVIDPPGMTRAWDPCLWHDPLGRMWWTWTQSCPMHGQAWDGRGGVWAVHTQDATTSAPRWSEPRRIAHGVALNKPLVTADGRWIMPVAIWWFFDQFNELEPMRRPGVLVSDDQGQAWRWSGGAVVDDRCFDEPMVVQRRDGSLWMLIRTRTGIAESFSFDGGISWSRGRPSVFAGPSSRFHFCRLKSGRLLLVNHLGNAQGKRSHLAAMLSEDDGATWPHRLLLDERERVSYPDVVEGPPGVLRVIYDLNRFEDREILMAVVTEDDIIAGQVRSPEGRLKALVNKAGR